MMSRAVWTGAGRCADTCLDANFRALSEMVMRTRQVGLGTALMMSWLVLAGPAPGQSQSVQDRLDAMQRELEAVRRENAEMRLELDELRAATGDHWLTEQRAAQIRDIVEGVLADVDTRSNLLDTVATAGWNENFFLASPDGRFLMIIDGQLQVRFVYSSAKTVPADDWGFETRRARLTMRGHVFDRDVNYLVRLATGRDDPFPAGFGFLQDAWVQFRLNDDWELRIGQFKLPFAREELVSGADQMAVERTLVNEVSTPGRSQGLELEYSSDTLKLLFALSDGGTNGEHPFVTPQVGLNSNFSSSFTADWALTGRGELLLAGQWDQFSDFTSPEGDPFGLLIGAAVHAQKSDTDDLEWYSVTADASIEWGGANAFLAYTHQYVDNATMGVSRMHGVVLQGGYYISPKVELFARGEWGDFDNEGASPDELMVAGFGANYYIDGHDIKWTTDVSLSFSSTHPDWAADITGFRPDAVGDEQAVFRSQLQLLY